MSSREGESVPEHSRMRAAVAIDGVAGLVAAVLLYPFPAMRAVLPTGLFVVSIIAAIFFVSVLVAALSLAVTGRTAGLFLLGMSVSPSPGPGRAAAWALGWTATAVLIASDRAVDADRGVASALSGLRVTRS